MSNICKFQFKDGKAVKQLFSMLKDVLDDVMFCITSNKIQVMNMNGDEDILIDLTIEVDKLDVFELKKDKILFSVDCNLLYKILNYCESKKPVEFFIKDDHYMDGVVTFLNIKLSNDISNYCLKTVENNVEIVCDKLDYIHECMVDSKLLVKKLRCCLFNADVVEFTYRDNEFFIENTNEYVKIRNKIENKPMLSQNHDEYNEQFLSKNLKIITKMSSFSETIDFCFLPDSPLLLELPVYDFGSLNVYFKHMTMPIE